MHMHAYPGASLKRRRVSFTSDTVYNQKKSRRVQPDQVSSSSQDESSLVQPPPTPTPRANHPVQPRHGSSDQALMARQTRPSHRQAVPLDLFGEMRSESPVEMQSGRPAEMQSGRPGEMRSESPVDLFGEMRPEMQSELQSEMRPKMRSEMPSEVPTPMEIPISSAAPTEIAVSSATLPRPCWPGEELTAWVVDGYFAERFTLHTSHLARRTSHLGRTPYVTRHSTSHVAPRTYPHTTRSAERSGMGTGGGGGTPFW